MFATIRRIHKRRTGDSPKDRENMVRLEEAEVQLKDLKQRAHIAITTLDQRVRRNHWRESIQEMIQGV